MPSGRQRDAIIRRGERYSIKYRMDSGKQKWESGFATKALAQSRLNEVLSELGEGDYIEPKSTTLEEFAGTMARQPSQHSGFDTFCLSIAWPLMADSLFR